MRLEVARSGSTFLRQHEQALAFLEKLLALLESNRAQHICRFADVMGAMSQLGECYFNLGRGEEALKMQKKQLQRAENERNCGGSDPWVKQPCCCAIAPRPISPI